MLTIGDYWVFRRKPPNLGQKFATLQIYKSSKQLKPRPSDQLSPNCSMAVNKPMLSFGSTTPCFLHYRLNSFSAFWLILTKHPTTLISNMLKSHKITQTTSCHSCSQPAVSPPLPPPHPPTHPLLPFFS